ncbi:MAG TPA: response regulator [Gemmatimonadales bacterium]|nr:response regulator [Gemmatimonadales bacterium]
MDSEAPRSDKTYVVACYHCQADFDALAGPWCACLADKRTIVCARCGQCFCRAPAKYKRRFWEGAPQGLWDRWLTERPKLHALSPNPRPEEAGRPLVLLVEDDPDVQRIMVRAIQELGYVVVLARDGAEGLDFARRYRPDVVLTDAFMPRLDGREMCRRLKDDPATSGIPVIIMTAVYTAARYKSEAFREFHADDYLAKPVELKQLRELLERHAARRLEP